MATATPSHGGGAAASFAHAVPPSTTGTLGPSTTDVHGQSLSLFSILAMVALDAPDPNKAMGARETADGRIIHPDGRVTRSDNRTPRQDPLAVEMPAKRTLDQSI